jgi:hypothetical protein
LGCGGYEWWRILWVVEEWHFCQGVDLFYAGETSEVDGGKMKGRAVDKAIITLQDTISLFFSMIQDHKLRDGFTDSCYSLNPSD